MSWSFMVVVFTCFYFVSFVLVFFENPNLCYHFQFTTENTIESNHFTYMFNSDLLIPYQRQTIRLLKDPVDPGHSIGLLLAFF